jgi:hypothetical protein
MWGNVPGSAKKLFEKHFQRSNSGETTGRTPAADAHREPTGISPNLFLINTLPITGVESSR